MADNAPQIFDNRRRMAFRERAVARGLDQSFLLKHMAGELTERLADVSRSFENVLLFGPISAFSGQILGPRNPSITVNIMQDEETLP